MADTIREYLVSLGFSVNEAQLNRFKEALGKTAQGAVSLGTEVVGAGLAITAMVEQVAKHFTDLYYMSQRTGSTVSSLSAIGFAAKQVGLSTEQAQGAVEAFASSMRNNPGLGGLFAGVTGTRATGDSEKDLRTLVKSLSRQPDFIAIQRASQFGLGEREYLQMKNNMAELEKGEREHIARLREAGVEVDRDKGKWTEFTRTLNSTADAISTIGERIAQDWREPVEGMLKDIQKLVTGFNETNKATGGWLSTVTGAVGAFGGVSALLALVTKGAVGLGVAGLGGITAALTGLASMLGLALVPLKAMQEDDKAGNPMRSALRSALGIPDDKGGAGVPLPRARPLGMGRLGLPSLDENAVPLPPVRPITDVSPLGAAAGGKSAAVTVNQTNHITGSFRDIEQIREKISGTNRELGDALRNLYQKVQ